MDDPFQCISEGVVKATDEEIILITVRQPEKMRSATRHTLTNGLLNIKTIFEFNHQLFIVLKRVKGQSLKTYLESHTLTYDNRIYLCYEMLKVIQKYDTFSNNIKFQLVALPQWRMSNDVLMLRELLHFKEDAKYSLKNIFSQIGFLMELILKPGNEPHRLFVDNLIHGNHHFDSIRALITNFKDIFIYEKQDIIDAIPNEVTISISCSEPFDELSLMAELTNEKALETILETVSDKNVETLPEIEPYVAETLPEMEPYLAETLPEIEPYVAETLPEIEAYLAETLPEIEPYVAETLPDFCDLDASEDPFTAQDNHIVDESIRNNQRSQSKMNTNRKAKKQRHKQALEKREKTLEKHEKLQESLEAPEIIAEIPKASFQTKHKTDKSYANVLMWLFPTVITVVMLFVIIFSVRALFFKPDIIEASYKIETLSDDRVAFINTSACSKKIITSEWQVYYNNQLVQSFITDNLYPVFDTDGDYTISLRIKDSEGNWSETYTEVYVYNSAPQ